MKITIDSFIDEELYAIATRLYYYFYLNDHEIYDEDPHGAVAEIIDKFKTDSIDIRDPNQVDQYFANECDVDSMMEHFIVVDPAQSYQHEINWLIHNETLRWKRWHQ